MKRTLLSYSGWVLVAIMVSAQSVWALEQIIRPYESVRSAGMGGVRLTTGLYDENFFGNPARSLANPKFRVTLFDPTFEINPNTVTTVKALTNSGDVLQKLGSTAGENNHGRIQTTMPAFYIPAGEEGKMAFSAALIASAQFDIDLRQSYQIEPQAVVDIGPAFTVARKFLRNDTLGVGVTAHVTYRLASKPDYSFVDLIQGHSISPSQSGGDGTMLDFDLGGTYRLPLTYHEFEFSAGAAINNLLGGGYSNLSITLLKTGNLPPAQPRTYGFGISAKRGYWAHLTDTVFALEFSDIANNPDGSLFRTVHLGGETHYTIFAFRAGINQGYFTAGLGIDLRLLTIDLATYGEEMSLNSGGLEDRRYSIRIALQI